MNEATGWCRGCHRTLDEIARWGTMSDEERAAVLEQIAGRVTQSGAAEARDT